MRRLLLATTAIVLLGFRAGAPASVAPEPGPVSATAAGLAGAEALLADWPARPHGEPVRGAFVGLHAGRTHLLFGQPMTVALFAVSPPKRRAYVHIVNAVIPVPTNDVRLSLTDERGRPIAYRLRCTGGPGGAAHEACWLHLDPADEHAVGRCWRPGVYRLAAEIDKPDDPTTSHSIPGRFRSNVLTLTVGWPGEAPERLEGAEGLAGRLRSLPFPRTLDLRQFAHSGPDFWSWVGGLDEESSDRLRACYTWLPAEEWRTRAARYAPASVPQGRPLTAHEAARLLADLTRPEPWVRMRGVMHVPRGAPPAVRAALAGRLIDAYTLEQFGPGERGLAYPIREAATDIIGRIGPEMIDPVLALAAAAPERFIRREATRVLGRIGPHPKTREYLRESILSPDPGVRMAAEMVALEWGRDGVEVVRELLRARGSKPIMLPHSTALVGRYGDPATDGPLLHAYVKAIGPRFSWGVIPALGALHYTPALPDLEPLVRDTRLDFNVRKEAVEAVLALLPAEAGDRLTLELMDPAHRAVCGVVFVEAGRRRLEAARPGLLAALESPDWYVRVKADEGLRGLAGLWEGVGFDAEKPDPKKWYDYWTALGK